MDDSARKPRVVIVGAGFGGIFAARTLANKPVDVLLIDSKNYHTFTPLLYQVATCALDPSEIAYPIRGIFRGIKNIECVMGRVIEIDKSEQNVKVDIGHKQIVKPYDYLLLATGSVPTYFGNDDLAENAFELRTLDDAIKIRNHILRLFERAVWTEPSAQLDAMLTLVVVGGGPTGIEMAGALYELYNHVLDPEYGVEKTLPIRVVLIEKMDNLLAPYPQKLQQSALRQLSSLGVEVITGNSVVEITDTCARLDDGREIPTYTVIWTAGVKASPVAEFLDVPLARGNTLPVKDTLSLFDEQRIFAVGDIAYLEGLHGKPFPMLIPVAKQQGILAAKNIFGIWRERNRFHFRIKI